MKKLRSPVLVTGAGGFIGRRLVVALTKAKVPVRALLLTDEAVPPEWGETIEVRRGDIREAADVAKAVSGTGTIFHLAALVGTDGTYDMHWNVTVEGSRNIYEAAAVSGSRVVVTTSICAYGDRIARALCAEDSERGTYQGAYGRAKQGQEDVAYQVAETSDLEFTIVRPSNVYGVGSGPWVDGLALALKAGALGIMGDGDGNAGLVHVENLVDALLLIAANDKTIGQTYNVCDNLDVSWARYLTDIAAAAGAQAPPNWNLDELSQAAAANEDPANLVLPKRPNVWPLEAINLMGSDNRFDTSRIRQQLGWTPRVGYDAALAEIGRYLAEP